jgi:hypothetical protein
MVKLYCRTRLCELHSLCCFYILQLLSTCTLPKRFLLVLTVFRDEIQSAFEDPKMIRNSIWRHFYSPVLPNYISVLLPVAVLPFIILLTCSFITSCSVHPIFLSSVLYSCLSALIFLSFLCNTLRHAWSGCHLRSFVLPSLLIVAFLLSVYIFATSLTSSFVFYFRIILLFHICQLFPASTECLNAA